MTRIPEAEAIAAARAALKPLQTHDWAVVQYLWEVVGEDVRWDEAAAELLAGQEECVLVFDPNPWNMPARIELGRNANCDDAPLGYRCSKDDVKSLLRQPWVSNADFYVLSSDESLIGFRSHEDVESSSGMWVPK